MKKILILGASVYQVPLIQTAKRLGLYTIVASIPGEYPGFAFADKVYYINTIDKEAILQAAVEEQIDGICTTGTDVAVATIGYVCERMGLAGVSEAAAVRATDKAEMKKAFQTHQVAASEFRIARTMDEVCTAAEEIGFPVVVKRVDSSGSRGITIVRQKEGLAQAFEDAISRSAKDYVLVEEMLKGTEIGVDGVVQGGRLIFLAPHEKFVYRSEKITIPAGHGFPYRGTSKVLQEIKVQMQRAVEALGLDNCSVNADVFVDGDRVYMIELGGRTGATCIPELISMYYGFDFYEKILMNALGEPLDFCCENMKPASYKNAGVRRDIGKCAVQETDFEHRMPCMAKLLMSPVNGMITGIDEKQIAELRRSGSQIVLDYPVGHPVEAMENGTTRIGHVVTGAESVEELDEMVSCVYRCIEVDGISLEELWKK